MASEHPKMSKQHLVATGNMLLLRFLRNLK